MQKEIPLTDKPPTDEPKPATTYQVLAVSDETAEIKRIVLQAVNGLLGERRAGAHVRVALPNAETRAYSLVKLPQLEPGQIALGVLREKASSGGSSFMHSLQVGDTVCLSEPVNRFTLSQHQNTLLLAGGIGVTPLLSMAVELASLPDTADCNWSMHYSGRSETSLGFVPVLQAICGNRLQLHYDDQRNALNIPALLDSAEAGTHVYVCGPAGMIDAVQEQVSKLGWGSDRLHYELFSDSADTSADKPFDVEIHATGQVVHVAADKTIIEALEQAGLDPLYDCQRGDCGICQCTVVDGIPEHRDLILTDAEKASNTVMQICVSRSQTPKLVIDL